MIEIQNVTLFLQKKEILHEISARFCEGNIYGLVGRNGSGKTMLMRCICGFVRPSSGQKILAGYASKAGTGAGNYGESENPDPG